jgi:peptide/nickel transport system permease protein
VIVLEITQPDQKPESASIRGKGRPRVRVWRQVLSSVLRKKTGRVGVGIVAGMLLFFFIASLVVPYNPNLQSGPANTGPTKAHPFGTDYIGRDVLTMTVWGSFPSISISIASSLGSVLIGLIVGVFSGYYRRIEPIFTGTADVVMTFPAFPLMILLGMLYPATSLDITLILVLVLWPPVSRAIRSQVLSVRERPFVEAAKLGGMKNPEIILRIIIPEVASIAIAYFVLTLSLSIVFVTGLEFLGVGNLEKISWGSILYWAQQFAFYNGDWWWILAPGISISLFATAFALIGFSIEEIMNPRLRV